MEDFTSHLHECVSDGRFSRTYAAEILSSVKSLIRWAYKTERLEELPRNLDDRSTCIEKSPTDIKTFTIAEIRTLLDAATERSRLYLLLMLNCGMTQVDIAKLRPEEVDWKKRTVTRKRSKTRRHEGVPTVTYPLWPLTMRLLRKHRSSDPDRVLTAENGQPLWSESLDSKDRLAKRDAIASAYRRLKRKTGIKKTLKVLRKTSSTLIDHHPEFRGLAELFLGHSPRSMKDRHYTAADLKGLARAVKWLGQEYGVV